MNVMPNFEILTLNVCLISSIVAHRVFIDKMDFCEDFVDKAPSSHRFCLEWMKSYFSTFRGRSKSKVLQKNLASGHLISDGDVEDLSHRRYRLYRLDHIHCLDSSIRCTFEDFKLLSTELTEQNTSLIRGFKLQP